MGLNETHRTFQTFGIGNHWRPNLLLAWIWSVNELCRSLKCRVMFLIGVLIARETRWKVFESPLLITNRAKAIVELSENPEENQLDLRVTGWSGVLVELKGTSPNLALSLIMIQILKKRWKEKGNEHDLTTEDNSLMSAKKIRLK